MDSRNWRSNEARYNRIAPQSVDDLAVDFGHNDGNTIIVLYGASENTTFALDAMRAPYHSLRMHSTDILERLKRDGITQAAIGEVLGISQPNVAKLYRAARNGKLRKLTWDEGQSLIAAFPSSFSKNAEPVSLTLISAESLVPLLDALLPLIPPRATAQSVEALGQGLAYGIRLLGAPQASLPSADAFAVAARAAVSRFHDLAPQ